MTNKKYELTDETKTLMDGTLVYRIKALIDLPGIKAGQLGGWVQGEHNLNQEGDCFVYGNAQVYHDAMVTDNAVAFRFAKVFDNAQVKDNAEVYYFSSVSGNAIIKDNARVFAFARVAGDAIISDNAWVTGPKLVTENISGITVKISK